jgi:Tol biopolymer transport system component
MKSDASRRARFIVLSSVIAASFNFTSSAQGQASASSRAASVLDSMPHAKKIDQVQLSPDGTQLAYIVDGELKVLVLHGGASHTIAVEGKLPLREVAWSADGSQLAFLADLPGDVPSAQLWTAAVDGGAPVKCADLTGYAENPRFSPDGSKLAVLFIEGMPRVAGPLQPMTPLAGVVDEKIYEQRIAVVDLRTNDLNRQTQVTPADV